MNLQLGTGQEVSIHNVESIEMDKTITMQSISAKDRYFRTIHVKTESGEVIEINLFSDNKEVLEQR